MTQFTRAFADDHQKRGPRRAIKEGKNKGKVIGGPTPSNKKRTSPPPRPSSHALARRGQPSLLNSLRQWRTRRRQALADAARKRISFRWQSGSDKPPSVEATQTLTKPGAH